MTPLHACHVSAQDLVAISSARSPQPVLMRAAIRSGMHVKVARYHKCRPSRVLFTLAPQHRARNIAANVSGLLPGEETSDTVNGNGASFNLNTIAPLLTYQSSEDASTIAVHGGERGGRPRVADSLTTPLVLTSTYTFKNTAELIAYQEGRYKSFEYGRYGNPTTRVVEEKIALLEKAEDCLLSSSGMNAATTMLLALVQPGEHIVTTTDCYRRTRQFIQTMLPKMNIGCTVIDPSDVAALEEALNKHSVRLFFSESPTNPYLRCVDIETVSKLCHAKGAVVCIDATFATPINTRPIEFGADLVIHSGTKYLAGHNDVLAGCIAGKTDLVEKIRHMHNILGGVIDPHASWMLLRGLKTLGLRVERQNANAMELAKFLQHHPKVEKVWYPGLDSHPDHAVAKKQMKAFGGVVSFQIKGDLWDTARFIDSVQLPYIAPSLGGVESLIEQPTVISYWDQPPEIRAAYGIKDNLVRFSCGVESSADIVRDVEQALEKV